MHFMTETCRNGGYARADSDTTALYYTLPSIQTRGADMC